MPREFALLESGFSRFLPLLGYFIPLLGFLVLAGPSVPAFLVFVVIFVIPGFAVLSFLNFDVLECFILSFPVSMFLVTFYTFILTDGFGLNAIDWPYLAIYFLLVGVFLFAGVKVFKFKPSFKLQFSPKVFLAVVIAMLLAFAWHSYIASGFNYLHSHPQFGSFDVNDELVQVTYMVESHSNLQPSWMTGAGIASKDVWYLPLSVIPPAFFGMFSSNLKVWDSSMLFSAFIFSFSVGLLFLIFSKLFESENAGLAAVFLMAFQSVFFKSEFVGFYRIQFGVIYAALILYSSLRLCEEFDFKNFLLFSISISGLLFSHTPIIFALVLGLAVLAFLTRDSWLSKNNLKYAATFLFFVLPFFVLFFSQAMATYPSLTAPFIKISSIEKMELDSLKSMMGALIVYSQFPIDYYACFAIAFLLLIYLSWFKRDRQAVVFLSFFISAFLFSSGLVETQLAEYHMRSRIMFFFIFFLPLAFIGLQVLIEFLLKRFNLPNFSAPITIAAFLLVSNLFSTPSFSWDYHQGNNLPVLDWVKSSTPENAVILYVGGFENYQGFWGFRKSYYYNLLDFYNDFNSNSSSYLAKLNNLNLDSNCNPTVVFANQSWQRVGCNYNTTKSACSFDYILFNPAATLDFISFSYSDGPNYGTTLQALSMENANLGFSAGIREAGGFKASLNTQTKTYILKNTRLRKRC